MIIAPNAESQVRFLLNLQRLLQEGSFVATYKHALLLGIADICVERGDDTGSTLRISTDELAEKFIAYYWRQVIPYQPVGRSLDGVILKQNTGRQSSIVSAIARVRQEYGNSLAGLKKNSQIWKKLNRDVAETIRVMPLWKLQTVGRQKLEFLYSHDPDEGRTIVLKEGISFCFRLFHGLVHELVTGAWLRFVRSINENQLLLGDATDLSEFMFGSRRTPLETYRPILMQYQKGDCFYCLKPLGDRGDVDHFIPWSRYPIDFGHNFVLAHSTCNTQKADRLAALEHLERWCERNDQHGGELATAFQEKYIFHDLRASQQITAWAYQQAQVSGSLMWKRKNELVMLTSEWRRLIAQVPLRRNIPLSSHLTRS